MHFLKQDSQLRFGTSYAAFQEILNEDLSQWKHKLQTKDKEF